MSDAVLATTVGVVNRHSLEVSPKEAMDLSWVNGKYYCGVSPGPWMIAIPVYLALKPVIQSIPDRYIKTFTPWLAVSPPLTRTKEVYFLQIALVWLVVAPLNALLAVLGYNLVRSLGQNELASFRTSLFFVFTFAFVYSCMYSRQFLSGTLLQIITLLALNREIRDLKYPNWEPWVSGLCIGICLTLDYSTHLLAAIVFIWLFVNQSRHQKMILSASTAIPLLMLAAFNSYLYGNPLLTAYHFRNWGTQPFHFYYKGTQYLTSSQFQSAKWLGFTFPSASSVSGLSFSLFKGVFIFCPILFGLTWTLKNIRTHTHIKSKTKALTRVALGSFLCAFIFNSSLAGEMYWSGVPIFFGPRFLISVVPLCVLWIFIQNTERKLSSFLIALGVLSVTISFMGAMYQDIMFTKAMDDAFLQNPIYNIVADVTIHGFRVPILDVYGIKRIYQNEIVTGILLLYALSFAFAHKIKNAEHYH